MSELKSVVYYQLEKHLPSNAVHYCFDLWNRYRFRFIVNRERRTKLGDYRYEKHRDQHIITVNNNLNQFSFLITYIHEVAHLMVSLKTGKFRKPHGMEWKTAFRESIGPMLSDLVFPPEILKTLTLHMKNPKATTQSDPALVKVLRKFDQNNHRIYLSDIQTGLQFSFKGKNFRKEWVRRTRAVCTHLESGKKYLISEIAEVQKLS